MRSELTKIVTLPSVWITTGILLALSIYFQFLLTSSIHGYLETLDANGMHWWFRRPVPADLSVMEDIGGAVFNPGIFFPVLGAVIAGAEFRTGQLGHSVLAVPDRVRLVLAKTVAAGLHALAFGLLFALMTLISGYLGVKDWRPDLIWRPEVLAGIAGSVVFVVVITLITFGITLVVRRTMIGILIMMGFTAILMTRAFYAISPVLDAAMPISAARNLWLQAGTYTDVDRPAYSSTPAMAALVLAGWVVIAVVGAVIAIQRRDAR
ncbi:MAG: hypothetical protein QM708_02775 [Propioniciclava sp.]|uniref:hypothetical protein n=1 Tax=Propioniciclava sp. TaxID=2038686 RepID=UPI0039E3948E